MKGNRPPEKPLGHLYEAIFSIFLITVAYLWRDNGTLRYPHVLYLLFLLFGLNLAAGVFLRRWPAREWMSTLIILSNCAVITGILEFSGKAQSNLWVLFLLPIYTTCLLLNGREIIWITLGAVGFNSVFYFGENTAGLATILFELSLKTGILAFAGLATWKWAQRDLLARRRIHLQQEDGKRLKNIIKLQELHVERSEKMADFGIRSTGIVYELQNHLSMILAHARSLATDTPLPLGTEAVICKITKSARACLNSLPHLPGTRDESESATGFCDVNQTAQKALDLMEKLLRQHKIAVKKDFVYNIPSIPLPPLRLKRLVVDLLMNMSELMPEGGLLLLKTDKHVSNNLDQAQITIATAATAGANRHYRNEPMEESHWYTNTAGITVDLRLCKEIVENEGGTFLAQTNSDGAIRFISTFPCRETAKAPL